MLNVKVDNIYINDTTNKIRINSDGVELKNEYYEYESPYVNDGLQFTLNVNSINVIIADKRKQDIIIPNSAPMFVDNKLKTFPIEYVEINLNENIRYIYINDTIKTLKITSENENVIISIPNKEFTITTNDTNDTTTTDDTNDAITTNDTQNKKIKYLILRDYSENDNFYNLTSLSATLINLTHNSDIDLFNDYNQISVSNLKNNIPQSEYNIYVLANQIKNYSKDKIITLDECSTIDDLPTNVCSNIDMDAKIEEKITFYRHYDTSDSFSIGISDAEYIVLQSHYAFIKTSSKIITYDFYTNSELKESYELKTEKFIVIDDNIHYVSNNDSEISIYSNTIPKRSYTIPKPSYIEIETIIENDTTIEIETTKYYTFQDIIRVNNNIVAVFSKDNVCSFVITTPEFKHFFNYEINVDKTINSINLYSSTHYSRLCCLINYSSNESITKQFKAYQKVDLFMKF